MIDPMLRNIYKLFVLSFKNGNDHPARNFFDEHYMPLVEIKNFIALSGKFLAPGRSKDAPLQHFQKTA